MKARCLACCFTLVLALPSRGAVYASDSAGNYGGTGQPTFSSGQNGGSGFGNWSFSNTSGNGSQNGEFLGTSAASSMNSGNGKSWGLYANNSQTASAYRGFSAGPLTANQQVSVKWQSDGIDLNSGGAVGIALLTGSGQTRFEFYFHNGDSSYKVNVVDLGGASHTYSTGIGFTTSPISLTFNQGAGTSWSLSIKQNGNTTTETSGGTSFLAASDISQIRFFDFNAAGNGSGFNQYFNNLELAVVPEPAQWGLISASSLLALGGLRIWRRRCAECAGTA